MVDAVGVGDDATAGRLPEDFDEPDNGNGLAVDEVAEDGAGSDGRKLVDVADEEECGRFREGAKDGVRSGMSTMEASSMTRRSVASWLSSLRRNPPVPGLTSRSRWMVWAGRPVASAMRRAARPVGAASRQRTCLEVRSASRVRRMVVFPTPGPPVMTRAR